MALYNGLKLEQPLAGILCFSSFMFPHLQTTDIKNSSSPIQIFHGESDPMLPWMMC